MAGIEAAYAYPNISAGAEAWAAEAVLEAAAAVKIDLIAIAKKAGK